ncbi:hypothetical protein PDE_06544 [Penicillium oxalicum 114-2]|uniref:Uncharacterized protein n=1 Tax=Penicillium oxalicum (strain 114-2 / CGMCC 5302) TaxID=933388 RepID=S7ZMK4_PENO1|nr:hypothetical protein PDE_06544 [Penicillium oxalicum 114-2]
MFVCTPEAAMNSEANMKEQAGFLTTVLLLTSQRACYSFICTIQLSTRHFFHQGAANQLLNYNTTPP